MRELSRSDLLLALDQCAAATGDREFVIVGSLAILGAYPSAPPALRVSQDIDLFSKTAVTLQKNRLIYERFGPDSDFAVEHDFYIEPVGEWVVMSSLPDWAKRLIKVECPSGVIGWCLSPLDIAYNKADAGREKDVAYLAELFRARLILPSQLKDAMEAVPIGPETAVLIHARIQEAIRRAS